MVATLGLAAAILGGCKGDPPRADPEPARPPLRVEWVKGQGADVAAEVQREVTRAKGDGRDLLVYVGATWCEPCQYFHQAAEKGQLDSVFPGLRLVEFDLDRDREALDRAGYGSKMIPLFAVPRADGTGSGQQIEGSIKGPGAVDQIRPRLQTLIDKARAGR
jgi:thiol-disulfide isomerase/thioredoxin